MLLGRADDKVEAGRLDVLKIRKDGLFDLINGSFDSILKGLVSWG